MRLVVIVYFEILTGIMEKDLKASIIIGGLIVEKAKMFHVRFHAQLNCCDIA
jgi:hypothetical protein